MPSWGLVLLTVAYLLILAVHLRHLLEVRGEARVWHLVHVLMALGMVNMAIPTAWTGLSGMPVNATVTGYFFAVITVFCAAMTGFALSDRDRVTTLWAMVSVGAAGMTWMYLYVGRDGWYAAVTVAFVAWFLSRRCCGPAGA